MFMERPPEKWFPAPAERNVLRVRDVGKTFRSAGAPAKSLGAASFKHSLPTGAAFAYGFLFALAMALIRFFFTK